MQLCDPGHKRTLSRIIGLVLMAILFTTHVCAFHVLGAEPPLIESHRKVYFEPGRYGGWPANYGIWSWGDEIVVITKTMAPRGMPSIKKNRV